MRLLTSVLNASLPYMESRKRRLIDGSRIRISEEWHITTTIQIKSGEEQRTTMSALTAESWELISASIFWRSCIDVRGMPISQGDIDSEGDRSVSRTEMRQRDRSRGSEKKNLAAARFFLIESK